MIETNIHKVLLIGSPKGAGKSTLAMTAPTPILDIQFDPGSPVIPPGVDGNQIYVKTYPAANEGINPDSATWAPAKDVGEDICRDILAIRRAVLAKEEVKLSSEPEPWPLPKTIVLDGLPTMDAHIISWLLAHYRVNSPDELENTFAFWGDRLVKNMALLMAIIPLPVNVVLITWSENEMKETTNAKGKKERIATGRIQPMLGGQLLRKVPGEVDAVLYCYSKLVNVAGKGETRFMVRTRANGVVEDCGVRNGYSLPDEIDVTIDPKKPGVMPWNRIWKS